MGAGRVGAACGGSGGVNEGGTGGQGGECDGIGRDRGEAWKRRMSRPGLRVRARVGPDSRKTVDRNVKEMWKKVSAPGQCGRVSVERGCGGGWKEGLWSDGEEMEGVQGRRNGEGRPRGFRRPSERCEDRVLSRRGGRRVLGLDRWALPGKNQ